MSAIDAEITLKVKAPNLIDEESLADWDGEGNGITLEEYVRMALSELELGIFDLTDFNEYEVVSVNRIEEEK